MKLALEIYLTKKYVQNNEWLELIKTISDYNGLFKKWKIIIKNDKNQIRYFMKTDCSLPSTINNLNAFLLKKIDNFNTNDSKFSLPYFAKNKNSFIDLLNYFEIENKGNIDFLEITIQKRLKSNLKFSIKVISNNNKYHKVLFGI